MIFKCKRSGNTVSFTSEQDIDSMLKNDGYEVVKEVKVLEIPVVVEPPKKLGRPKKK